MKTDPSPPAPYEAWITSGTDGIARRRELQATSIPDCIRRALADMPRGSRASCRASDDMHALVATLATERRAR